MAKNKFVEDNIVNEGVGVNWTETMALHLAIVLETGCDESDFTGFFELTDEWYQWLRGDEMFEAAVSRHREFVRENKEVTFEAKARVVADDLLAEVYKMAKDPSVSPSVRAGLISDVVTWAGFSGKGKVNDGGVGGPRAMRVTINVGGDKKVSVNAAGQDLIGGGTDV
jgi:hypothetical protein